MTQSGKPRQLEAGEFLHTKLREHERYRTREGWAVAGKIVHEDMATVEAACIAKGRAEAEERIRELEVSNREMRRDETRNERDDLRLRVSELEAQLAAPRWIPTAERLPEAGERVLFATAYASQRLRYVGHRWHNTWLADGDRWLSSEVTHWMPLPPLPSEET